MDNLSFLFAAFLTVWLILGYMIYRISAKQKSLDREIEELKGRLEEKPKP
jgi:CcmD family protein